MSRQKESQMKGNSKKLAIFVMMAAVMMFSAAAMAWDGDNYWRHLIQGDYAVSGPGNCIMAIAGFTTTSTGVFYPNPGPFQISNGPYEGIYTFHHDGTGSYRGLGHLITYPALPTAPGLATVVLSEVNYNFTYTVGEGGLITFLQDGRCGFSVCSPIFNGTCQAPPGPTYLDNPPKYGVISPDGMNLTVTGDVPLVMTVQTGCPTGTPGTAPTQLICNIYQTGFKVPKTFQLPTY